MFLGAVTVVRFSPNGRYLASGSDDRVLLIWEKDENGIARREFGEQEHDLEHWSVRKRLVGHDNDIQDIAWAPDSNILVSVGLDSAIIIWNGITFEKIKRLDVHQSHVKGVIFDPANKYFATCSDDRSLRIFRYHKTSPNDLTFAIEHIVSKPFESSPLTSYFRRCSWSPDGNHICAPNATNGPVSTCTIISRGVWTSDVSLIGHDAPCEVVSFSPRLYDNNSNNKEKKQKNINENMRIKDNLTALVATAGQDKTLAIWSTSNPRPLVVAHDICLKAITDLAWSPDGRHLFIASLDSSITVIGFDENELGKEVPLEKNEDQLHRYGGGRDAMYFPESIAQLQLEDKASKLEEQFKEARMDELMGTLDNKKNIIESNVTGSSLNTSIQIQKQIQPQIPQKSIQRIKQMDNTLVKQKITITKDGKKRVTPTLISSISSVPQRYPSNLTNSNLNKQSSISGKSSLIVSTRKNNELKLSKSSYQLPRNGIPSIIIGNKMKTNPKRENDIDITNNDDNNNDNNNKDDDDNDNDDDDDFFNSEINGIKYNVLPLINNNHINGKLNYPDFIKDSITDAAITYSDSKLIIPKMKVTISNKNPNLIKEENKSNSILEIRNGHGNEEKPSKITVTKNGNIIFIDYIPQFITHETGIEGLFWSIATQEGTLIIYSSKGRRLCPEIELGSPICVLESINVYLFCITFSGLIYVWDLSNPTMTIKCIHHSISIAPILDYETIVKIPQDGKKIIMDKQSSITYYGLSNNGTPLISLDNGKGYIWDSNMLIWVVVSDPWWFQNFSNSKVEQNFDNDDQQYMTGPLNILERRTKNKILNSLNSLSSLNNNNNNNNKNNNKNNNNEINKPSNISLDEYKSIIQIGRLETRIEASDILKDEILQNRLKKDYVKSLSNSNSTVTGLSDRLNECVL